MREIDIFHRPAIGPLILLKLLFLCSTVASAQDANDVISLFRGLAQTAIVQSTRVEWQKLPKDELGCLGRALVSRGESVQSLIQQGIQPSDRRVSDLRASCAGQPAQRVANGDGQSAFVVDGLQLGGKVQQDSPAYRQYQCSPSEQFAGYTWCQKKKTITGSGGPFAITNSILHSVDGTAVYVNQYVQPAFFKNSEISDQIARLSKKFDQAAKIYLMPDRVDSLHAIIASWGNILIEKLSDSDMATVSGGQSPKSGILLDFLGDFQKSARAGLPVFRVTGGEGFIWSASYDEKGRGHLRFLGANALQFTPVAVTIDTEISRPVALGDGSTVPKQSVETPVSQNADRQSNPMQDSKDSVRAEAIAAENRRLVEAKKAAAEETERQRIADAASAKLTVQAFDNARQAAEQARAEALQAKRAAEMASEDARERSQLYLTISGGMILVLIISIVFLLYGKRWTRPGRSASVAMTTKAPADIGVRDDPKDIVQESPGRLDFANRSKIEGAKSASAGRAFTVGDLTGELLNCVLVIALFPILLDLALSVISTGFVPAFESPNFSVTFETNANNTSMTVVEVQLMDEDKTSVRGFLINGSEDCRIMATDPGNPLSSLALVFGTLAQSQNSTEPRLKSEAKPKPRSEIMKMGDKRRIVSANCEPVQIKIITDRGESTYIKNAPIGMK